MVDILRLLHSVPPDVFADHFGIDVTEVMYMRSEADSMESRQNAAAFVSADLINLTLPGECAYKLIALYRYLLMAECKNFASRLRSFEPGRAERLRAAINSDVDNDLWSKRVLTVLWSFGSGDPQHEEAWRLAKGVEEFRDDVRKYE